MNKCVGCELEDQTVEDSSCLNIKVNDRELVIDALFGTRDGTPLKFCLECRLYQLNILRYEWIKQLGREEHDNPTTT